MDPSVAARRLRVRDPGAAATAQDDGIGLRHRGLAGRDVLAAGEITFARTQAGWCVAEVTNQSTGYCPDPDSWPAVAAALSQVTVRYPAEFTDPVVFRRCPDCRERNIVRDGDFICALCGSDLPAQWNFTAD